MSARHFVDSEYSKNKRVSCIKFHPTQPHLAAMSMVENMDFDSRAKISGKSFDSNVLILNFKDAHIINLSHVLETPMEVTTIEFHPESPTVLIGGCLNGQLIVWDTSDSSLKVANNKSKSRGGGEGEDDDGATASANDDEDEEKS
jgi:WD40 repeat protein